MAAERYTLWGWTSRWATKPRPVTRPLGVTNGSLRDCRARERQFKADYPDALTAIRTTASGPDDDLTAQVQQRIEENES